MFLLWKLLFFISSHSWPSSKSLNLKSPNYKSDEKIVLSLPRKEQLYELFYR